MAQAGPSGDSSKMALRALKEELKRVLSDPVDGFIVDLGGKGQLLEWNIIMFGSPDTLREGAYYKAKLNFPLTFPYSPPVLTFATKIWHPNVYRSGEMCISILRPYQPGQGIDPSECWHASQTVRSILISVIAVINTPNIDSPANVDAAKMYRAWMNKEGTEYPDLVKMEVESTKMEACFDGVKVPVTVEEYCDVGYRKPVCLTFPFHKDLRDESSESDGSEYFPSSDEDSGAPRHTS